MSYPAASFVCFNPSKNVTYPQAQQVMTALQQLALLNPMATSKIWALSFTSGPQGAPYATVDEIDGMDLVNGLYYFCIGSQLSNQASPDFWECSTLQQIMAYGGVSAAVMLAQQMAYNAAGYTPQTMTISGLPNGVSELINKAAFGKK